MFSFFKKKDKKKIARSSDKIWMKYDRKVMGIETDLKAFSAANKQIFVFYFFDSSKTLMEDILKKNQIEFFEADRSNSNSGVVLVNANSLLRSMKLQQKLSEVNSIDSCEFLFPDHYPLFSREIVVLEEIGRLLSAEPTVQFYVSMDEPLMQKFGSDRLIKVMSNMGFNEDEFVQHRMISESIKKAQQKLDETISSDNPADSPEAWFRSNIAN